MWLFEAIQLLICLFGPQWSHLRNGDTHLHLSKGKVPSQVCPAFSTLLVGQECLGETSFLRGGHMRIEPGRQGGQWLRASACPWAVSGDSGGLRAAAAQSQSQASGRDF